MDQMTISCTHRTILSQRSSKILVRCTQEAVIFVTDGNHKHDCIHSPINSIFGLGQSKCGVTSRHIGRSKTCDCVHLLFYLILHTWELGDFCQITSYDCQARVWYKRDVNNNLSLLQFPNVFSTHSRKNGLPEGEFFSIISTQSHLH